ncbi:MAG: hypothetical protein E7445_01040 [Ruminococcaceae bacterium]|nr:hypothetical protein [Oscillospiraceae bacterium]
MGNQKPKKVIRKPSAWPAVFWFPDKHPVYILYQGKGVTSVFGRGGNRILGIFAVALGVGILISAIFPVGALLFLVAFLLIGCGCACCRF